MCEIYALNEILLYKNKAVLCKKSYSDKIVKGKFYKFKIDEIDFNNNRFNILIKVEKNGDSYDDKILLPYQFNEHFELYSMEEHRKKKIDDLLRI